MKQEQAPLVVVEATCGAFLVWSAADVDYIRRQARIVGCLVGTDARKPKQNDQLVLPLQLLREEAAVLVNNNFARIVKLKSSRVVPNQHDRKTVENYRKQLHEDQATVRQKERISEQLSQAETIARGKAAKREKRKMFQQSTNGSQPTAKQMRVTKADLESAEVTEEDVEEAREQIRQQPKEEFDSDDILVELQSRNPLTSPEENYEPVDLDFDDSIEQRTRLAVFQDIWSRGFYLTSGIKFGSDFLAYPGDPMKFHASYMIVCVQPDRELTPTELCAWSRLATQVKKIVLLSYLPPHSDVPKYISINWIRSN